MKSRTFITNIDLLDINVVLFIGDDFAVHKMNFCSLAEDSISKAKTEELMDLVFAEISKKADDGTLGITVIHSESGFMPFIYLKTLDFSVLVHELVHVVNAMMKFYGISSDNDEIQAKLTEFLFKRFSTYISMEKDNEDQN